MKKYKNYKKRDYSKWYQMELFILKHNELTLRDKIILITLASWRGSGVICPKLKQISERLNYSSISDISKSLKKSKYLGIIDWIKHANKSNEYYFCFDILNENSNELNLTDNNYTEEIKEKDGLMINDKGNIVKRMDIV